MGDLRRLRRLAAVGVLAVILGVRPGPPAAAAPSRFVVTGGGYGHGIGMSQYGAYGMALRGVTAGRIIAFYYGGARAASATLPGMVRVGLLQAGRDPSTGGRLGRVLVRGIEVPGLGGSGAFTVSGVASSGRVHRKALPGHVTFSIRPEAGGTSVFDGTRRVFGPTRSGAGVVVRYETGAAHPARILLLQTGQQLRHGRLDVNVVHDEHRTARPRAIAVMRFNHYLRGLAEMPGSWRMEALKAQAIAARSYGLAVVLARGQAHGATRWDGCNCGLYGDVRDQAYSGYAKEVGYNGSRWVASVVGTGSLVVRWGSRIVQAFYSSSSGGYTSSNAQWGSSPLPWFPGRPDPDDRAGGRNPNYRWTVTLSATTAGARLGVGTVLAMAETKIPSWGGRVSTVRVRGSRKTVTVTGAQFRAAFGLKSTKFHIDP
jgi:stage II sporulation protein D